jgi:hypothetical protein
MTGVVIAVRHAGNGPAASGHPAAYLEGTTMAKTDTAAPATATTIPVRLSLLIHLDPEKWEAPAVTAEDAPEFDLEKTVAALTPLYGEDRAREMAAELAPAPADPDRGPNVIRGEVRAYVLRSVKALDALTKAGASVVDADRK